MTQPAPRRKRSTARWWVGIACALATGIAAGGDTSPAPFAVWAMGLPSGSVVMESQDPVIRVTPEDVARGAVEVHGGTRLVVVSNAPAGFAMDLLTRGSIFQAVQIDGIGGTAELGSKGGTLVQAQVLPGRRVVALDYRFVLAPGATPGTYAWPLELAVRGLTPTDLHRLSLDRRVTDRVLTSSIAPERLELH